MSRKNQGKRGLGRGLAALIPESEPHEGETIQQVPLREIRPNAHQPRQVFDEEKLAELTESVRTHGVLQPVVLRPVIGGYELVAGERRWRAAQAAGLSAIPAVVRELSDSEMTEVALIENIQREDLNPLEEAAAYERLSQEFGLTQEELARRVGKSRSHIANILRLLNLPPEVQANVSRGTITMGHARALLALPEAALQAQVCRQIIDKGLSVRETENLVRSQLSKKERQKKKEAPANPWLAEMETRLKQTLSTQVRIKQGRRRGKIEIEYYSLEDLERLTALLLSPDENGLPDAR
ncbi:MAG: ParB/RepB/Spo0J family partition protein [Firmicutes bacterium]|nr:ParB/RepB/Spo0J family partition protein [Bacillota bacterium]